MAEAPEMILSQHNIADPYPRSMSQTSFSLRRLFIIYYLFALYLQLTIINNTLQLVKRLAFTIVFCKAN